jgi:hypothetical protein
VRELPPDAQDDIARIVLQLAGSDVATTVPLTSEERAAIAASKSAAARGEFATDEQVRSRLGQARLVKLRYTLPAFADLDSILEYVEGNRRKAQSAFSRAFRRSSISSAFVPTTPSFAA